jgi:hypothetical protein
MPENGSDELNTFMHILCISMEEDDFLGFFLTLLTGNSQKINLIGISLAENNLGCNINRLK